MRQVWASRGVLVQQTATGSMVVRLAAGHGGAELISMLGPLAAAGGLGQEAVLRVGVPGLASAGRWATDANGLQLMGRRRVEANSSTYKLYERLAQNMHPQRDSNLPSPAPAAKQRRAGQSAR